MLFSLSCFCYLYVSLDTPHPYLSLALPYFLKASGILRPCMKEVQGGRRLSGDSSSDIPKDHDGIVKSFVVALSQHPRLARMPFQLPPKLDYHFQVKPMTLQTRYANSSSNELMSRYFLRLCGDLVGNLNQVLAALEGDGMAQQPSY